MRTCHLYDYVSRMYLTHFLKIGINLTILKSIRLLSKFWIYLTFDQKKKILKNNNTFYITGASFSYHLLKQLCFFFFKFHHLIIVFFDSFQSKKKSLFFFKFSLNTIQSPSQLGLEPQSFYLQDKRSYSNKKR